MDFSSRNIEKRKYFFYYKIFWILVGTYIFIAWHLKFEIKFFLLKVCGKNLKLEHFPWICTENFQIRIWICIENFWIQDPDPCKNSYGSASLVKIYTATSWHKNFNLLGLQGFFIKVCLKIGSNVSSFVDPNTLNLDLGPGFWPYLEQCFRFA